jgi:hypothetical protein
MESSLLKDLLQAKGETCASIIIPTHHYSRERRGDKIELKKAIHEAKAELSRHTTPDTFKDYEIIIDEWVKNMNYNHNLEGLGMFLSPSVQRMIKFPFPVKEKIVVSDSFEVRDVIYTATFADPYFVLLLSEKDVRLLRGSLEELEEIHNDDFPDVYVDTHEYQSPSRGSSYAGHAVVQNFEGDKSLIKQKRFSQFFKVIDQRLTPYLKEKIPLIVVAPIETLLVFEEETTHEAHIAATIQGNYAFMNAAQLSDIVFPEYVRYMKSRTTELIQEYEESVGYNLGITGVNNIWQAVRAGKGRKLVVEKDFTQEAFMQSDENRLLFKEPAGAHKVVVDIIDDIIEMMIEKGGDVYFTDNDQLKDYGRMVLITRYK